MRSQRRRPLGGAKRRPATGFFSEVMRDHYTGAIINPAMRSELLRDLQGRELIADVTTPDELDAHLTSGRRTAYVGFDPTADSLHVGSLLPLLTLRRVQLAGHRPIVLVGGGTGLIGDPSGKAGERALNPKEQVAEWAERLKRQVRPFLDFDRGPNAAILADNYAWLSELDVIGFLRDIGKHFPVGAMLARESVKARMGAGISFTEFSYQVLQAYDFMSLMLLHDCSIQLGGSDQWGNITAGVELIRRVQGRPAFGLTMPLVTKTDGSKFGKTESGTIWLDPARTSAYEMYQFWLNTPDADVVRFLRYFTFLPPERIAELAAVTRAVPEKREAQRVLARDVTALVHGEPAMRKAEAVSAARFGGDPAVAADLPDELEDAQRLPAEAAGWPLWKVIKEAGWVTSTSEARRLIQGGGVEVDGVRATSIEQSTSPGRHTVKLGKRRINQLIIEGPRA
jgi:tyrosyl-tRNA synthetase